MSGDPVRRQTKTIVNRIRERVEPMLARNNYAESDFERTLPPVQSSFSEDGLMTRLQTVLDDMNNDRVVVDENDIKLSLSEQVKKKVQAANNESFDSILVQIESVQAVINTMKQLVEKRREEANTKAEEICAFMGNMIEQTTHLAQGMNKLGSSLLDHQV